MYGKKLNATFLVKKKWKLVVKIYTEMLKVSLFTELLFFFNIVGAP